MNGATTTYATGQMQSNYDASELKLRVTQLAATITKLFRPGEAVNVVGIRTRGEYLARRLLPLLAEGGIGPVNFGALDITLYRDDLSEVGPRAIVRPTVLGFDIDRRPLVLVDDVLFTGRTVRAALDALADFGRPSVVRLAVLVDRGGRELPIAPDAVGLSLTDLPPDKVVKVKLVERDGVDGIEIAQRRTA